MHSQKAIPFRSWCREPVFAQWCSTLGTVQGVINNPRRQVSHLLPKWVRRDPRTVTCPGPSDSEGPASIRLSSSSLFLIPLTSSLSKKKKILLRKAEFSPKYLNHCERVPIESWRLSIQEQHIYMPGGFSICCIYIISMYLSSQCSGILIRLTS